MSLEAKDKDKKNIIPSTTLMLMDPDAHASGAHSGPDSRSLSHSSLAVPSEADYTESSNFSEDECLIWSPAPTLTTFCSDDMPNIPIPAIDDWTDMDINMNMELGWTEEFTLGFGLNAQQRQDAEHVVRSSGPSTWYCEEDVVRLKDVWPADVPPPWDPKWPSLWVQCEQ